MYFAIIIRFQKNLTIRNLTSIGNSLPGYKLQLITSVLACIVTILHVIPKDNIFNILPQLEIVKYNYLMETMNYI